MDEYSDAANYLKDVHERAALAHSAHRKRHIARRTQMNNYTEPLGIVSPRYSSQRNNTRFYGEFVNKKDEAPLSETGETAEQGERAEKFLAPKPRLVPTSVRENTSAMRLDRTSLTFSGPSNPSEIITRLMHL